MVTFHSEFQSLINIMYLKIIAGLMFLLSSVSSYCSESIIPNGDFELTTNKYKRWTAFDVGIASLRNWNRFGPDTFLTAQYFYLPNSIKVLDNNNKPLVSFDSLRIFSVRGANANAYGTQEAASGIGYIGISFFNKPDYVEVRLKSLLNKGSKYRIKMKTSLAETSQNSINGIPVNFSIKPYGNKINNYSSYIIRNKDNSFLIDTMNWTELELDFVATGEERYFSIGSIFGNSKNVNKKKNGFKPVEFFYDYKAAYNGLGVPVPSLDSLKKNYKNFIYYFIDDVSLESLEEETNTRKDTVVLSELELSLQNLKKADLKTIKFSDENPQWDTADLRVFDSAAAEIEKNYTFDTVSDNKTRVTLLLGRIDPLQFLGKELPIFLTDSASAILDSSKKELFELVEYLKLNPLANVRIRGGITERVKYRSHWTRELSPKIESIRQFLINNNIEQNRIITYQHFSSSTSISILNPSAFDVYTQDVDFKNLKKCYYIIVNVF